MNDYDYEYIVSHLELRGLELETFLEVALRNESKWNFEQLPQDQYLGKLLWACEYGLPDPSWVWFAGRCKAAWTRTLNNRKGEGSGLLPAA